MLQFAKNLVYYAYARGQRIAEPINGVPTEIREPVYICPLCRKGYRGFIALSAKPPSLSLEHSPPRSMGGKANVLTCRSCNSESGHDMESEMKIDLKKSLFIRNEPNSELPVTGHLGKSHFKTKFIRIDPNSIGFVIDERWNNPIANKFLNSFISGNNEELSFIFNLPVNDDFNLACLKSGHLEAFRAFGYSYLLDENAKVVIDTITDKQKRIEGHGLLELPNDLLRDGLHFAKVKGLRFFVVVIRLKADAHVRTFGVAIPGHGKQALNEYMQFSKALNKHKVDLTLCPDYRLPEKEPHPDRYQLLWEECLRRDASGEGSKRD